jgi:nucleotide-binding universal stress UspA family protein
MAGHPVVVGVDGSTAALDAVTTAAAEAVRHQRPLLILSALSFPVMGAPVDPRFMGEIERDLRAQADHTLRAAAARAAETAPDLEVRTQVIVASAAAALVAASARASVVVLGAHGRSAFTDLVAGSVAIQVATHSHAPVVIVRGRAAPDGDVAVGADGSAYSEAALGFAFEEAARRHTGVTAVRAWRHPVSTGPGDMLPLVEKQWHATETARLEEWIAPWRAKFPDVAVRFRVSRGGATSALIAASADAQLVVVGARGHGGFTGLLLGSVGQALMHHAHSPVAIIRTSTD